MSLSRAPPRFIRRSTTSEGRLNLDDDLPSGLEVEDLSECIAAWDAREKDPLGLGSCLGDSLPVQSSQPPQRSLSGASLWSPQQRTPCWSPPGAQGSWSLQEESSSSVVTVSVGGKEFMASASTLRKAPYFAALLYSLRRSNEGCRSQGSVCLDEKGHLFVDRSAELFTYVLEFLRSGRWLLRDSSRDFDFIVALRDEALFYGLECDLPVPQISEYATVWQFRDDTAIYVDCHEQMIREDPDNQGLFRLCRYSGSLPLDQQSGTRRFKATSQSIQAVIAYFAMRGFRLGHVIDGSLLTHQTSADGQGRTGPAIQYVFSRQACPPEGLQPPATNSSFSCGISMTSPMPPPVPPAAF
eukprot:TRINITY_DN75582_c0_g1_i1.p1 TRINITY_DN75582_c0_g1~~TRINITY_DN75582_c0_g1_i1.p1  ORF type:complete len:355 (+),score=64.59 TRINITY_DN75582_c0_g1_i1:86-1150(+)